MKILTIERPINSTNPYAFKTGTVDGDDPDAEGYEETSRGHIDPRKPAALETEARLRKDADAIFEVDNLAACTGSFRVK